MSARGNRAPRSATDAPERLLRAATVLFTRQGYAGTGINQICTRARIAKTALYWHFGSKEELFAMKDRLEAAEIEVAGAVDHGIFWSIYFFDPVNNLPLEVTWNFFEFTGAPAMYEVEPLEIVAEGADPQPGHWPEVTRPTPPEEMTATPGNGVLMRQAILESGTGHISEQGKAAGITPDV